MDFANLEKAAGAALRRVTKVAGGDTDPDLMLYKQLKPSHFPLLIEKYGEKNVLEYIDEMERRLKEGNNG